MPQFRWIQSCGVLNAGSVGTKASHQPDGAAEVRFHGVLVRGGLPYNSRYRDRVTPIRCGKLKKLSADANAASRWIERAGSEHKRKGMCCTLKGIKAQRLKRVFNIDVSISRRAPCLRCLWRPDEDDASRIIASIEDSFVIGKILCHLKARCCLQGPENRGPGARGPPPAVC